MKYLFIDEAGDYGFKVSGIHDINDDDVELDEAIYERFFQEQSSGKSFILKDINGTTFEEIFEEIIPGPPVVDDPTELELLKQEHKESKAELAKSKLETDLALKKINKLLEGVS